MSKGKFRMPKALRKKKTKKAFKQINSALPWKRPKEQLRLMIMPTDVLLVYFATFPIYDQIHKADENIIAFGEELLNFADTLPTSTEGENQRKFITSTVWIVAHIMKVQELFKSPYLIYLNGELPKKVEEIHSEHFKNTVLSDSSFYMRFMKYFLTPAGVMDRSSSLPFFAKTF